MKHKYIFLIFFIILNFHSRINAQSWQRVTVVDSTDFYSLTIHNNSILAITGNEIFIGTENGNIWKTSTSKPQVSSLFTTIYSYKGLLYLGTLGDGVYYSSDNGETWNELNTGLGKLRIIEFAGLGENLFAGTGENGVYMLDLQNANNWKVYNTGVFQYGTNSLGTTGEYLLAGLGPYLFVRSENDAQWNNVFVDSGELQRDFYDFITLDNYLFAGTNNGVYRGNLQAGNWERKDISVFPGMDIGAFAIEGSRLYAAIAFGNEHWIFSSDNYGDDWQIRAHEFSWLYSMLVSGNRMWAGRLDGLWYYNLDGSTGIDEPIITDKFELSQNYPNPFNPVTSIQYTIPVDGIVSLKVFDILGNEVADLENKYKNSGTHKIIFNASNLSSGVYIYRIQAGKFIGSKKLILLK